MDNLAPGSTERRVSRWKGEKTRDSVSEVEWNGSCVKDTHYNELTGLPYRQSQSGSCKSTQDERAHCKSFVLYGTALMPHVRGFARGGAKCTWEDGAAK